QAGRADDRGDHGIAGIAFDQRHQCVVAAVGEGVEPGVAQAVTQRCESGRIGDNRVCGTVATTQVQQRIDLLPRCQHGGAQAVRVAGDHIQCRGADRPGGAQYRDPSHRQKPNTALPSANAGSAASTPSSRSRTPPWPGMRAPESLTPACRLSRLSNRSPTTESNPASSDTSATAGNCTVVAPANSDSTTPVITASNMPPMRPSTVLLGLILGASLCRPNLRPLKYAPVSAAHTTISAHNSQR